MIPVSGGKKQATELNVSVLFSQGYHHFAGFAISDDLLDTYVGPCGGCRQFLCEFNPVLPIYLVRPDKAVEVTSLAKLLPECSPKTMDLAFHNGV